MLARPGHSDAARPTQPESFQVPFLYSMSALPTPALLTLESVALDELSTGNDQWHIDFSSVEKHACIHRLKHMRGPRLRHSRFDFKCSISAVSCVPEGHITFALSQSSTGRPTWNHQRLYPNEMVVLYSGEPVHYLCEPNEALFTVTTTLEHYEQCRELYGTTDVLKQRQGQRYQAHDHYSVLNAVNAISVSLNQRHPPDVVSGSQWEATLLSSLLQALSPRQDSAREAPLRRHIASQAIEYLHAHAHTALCMEQLTQTLGTHGRTLHQGFVETFGTTPMAYLRTLRLSNARHDLLTQRWATVTETAMQWNFFHLGRFSQDYQRIYGETPSQTFRRNSA